MKKYYLNCLFLLCIISFSLILIGKPIKTLDGLTNPTQINIGDSCDPSNSQLITVLNAPPGSECGCAPSCDNDTEGVIFCTSHAQSEPQTGSNVVVSSCSVNI